MAWYNANWEHRKKISVVAENVPTASYENYPFWFTTSDAEILAACRDDFQDLVFTADDGTTQLNHELKRFKIGDITYGATQSNTTAFLQGITKDDSGNFYVSAKGGSYPGKILKYDSSWSLVTSHQLGAGDNCTQIADIFWKDGYIYVADATTENDVANSLGGRVVRFNDDDLSYDSVVLSESNTGYFTEGVVFYNNKWWLTFGQVHDNSGGVYVRRYDSSWAFEKEYHITEQNDAQGIGFIEYNGHSYMLLTVHNEMDAVNKPSALFAYMYYDDSDSFSNVSFWLPNTASAYFCQGFHVGSLDGSSVLFADRVSANIRTTDLSALIQGELLGAWVSIPELTDSSKIYVYYGNPSAGDSQDITGVWSDFVGVWHDGYIDSGANNLLMGRVSPYTNPSRCAGKLAGAINAGGANGDYLALSSSATRLSSTMWATVWMNYDTIATGLHVLIGQALAGETSATNVLYQLAIYNTKKISAFWEYGNGTNVESVLTNAVSINAGEWHRVTFIRTTGATSEVSIYFDGELKQTFSSLTNPSGGSSTELRFAEGSNAVLFDGKLSEIWISSGSFDGDKELTLYNNQNDPAAFFGLGAEEPTTGWGGKVCGQSPAKVQGIAVADITSVAGVT